jgi:ribonuclease Z
MPTQERNVPALALQFEQSSEWWLFDCGEGTQRQLLSTNYSPARLERIFITHLHGDHCLGVFGLLASRSLNKITQPVVIHAPKGMSEMMDVVWRHTGTHLQFDIRNGEIPLTPLVLPQATVTAVPLSHNITTYAFVIQEPDRPGRFNIDKARELGIPMGPHLARLKAGEIVRIPDGREFNGQDFTELPIKGRRIVIAGDNRSPDLLLPYLTNVDVLIHEATFTKKMLQARNDEMGEKYAHSTAAQVAVTAEKAGVPNLILTHFSAGFSRAKNKPFSSDQLLWEAKAEYHGNCVLARDYLSLELSRDGVLKSV